VWAGVKGTLDAYAASCRSKGAATDPVWGVMMEVGAMVAAEGAALPATNGHSEE